MGCSNDKVLVKYNELVTDIVLENASGPYVLNTYKNYLKNVEEMKDKTLIESIDKSLLKYENQDTFGYRKWINETEFESSYTFYTTKQASEYAYNFARNVKDLELVKECSYDFEGNLKIMGIYSRNCFEFIITDIALMRDSITSVTFYTTLGDKSFQYIFNQTKVETVCISHDNVNNLIKYHKQFNFETLKNVILYDLTIYSDDKIVKQLEDLGLKVYSFKSLIEDKKSKTELTISKPDTLMTLCYTSGTTSLPKGVKITQNMFYCTNHAMEDSGFRILKDEVYLSYLPMAHVMERNAIIAGLQNGAIFKFICSHDIKKHLKEDILLSKPSILVTPPRLLSLFHQAIMNEVSKLTGCKKSLFERAMKTKIENYNDTGEVKHFFYDNLIFKKIQQMFGGNVRIMVSGGAPLPELVSRDMKVIFSCNIMQGYGMTETTGATTCSHINDLFTNGMGINRFSEFKLVDVPELNYNSKTQLNGVPSPTGEICLRGLNVTKGYFLDLEKTKELFDKDGWLKTGDVGRILPENKGLIIIDRVKEIFKLSQGEYIAPSKLESVYVKNNLTLQICIYGDSYKNYIIAIICPNKIELQKFLIEKGIMKESEDVTNFYDSEVLHEEYKKIIEKLAKDENFNSLEKPQKFIFSKVDFSIDNDMLTPSMKLKRNKISEYFREQISKCYE